MCARLMLTRLSTWVDRGSLRAHCDACDLAVGAIAFADGQRDLISEGTSATMRRRTSKGAFALDRSLPGFRPATIPSISRTVFDRSCRFTRLRSVLWPRA